MTVKELSSAVKSLTEKYDYFDEEAFISAAGIALGAIFSDMHSVGRASFFLSAPKIMRHIEEIRHKANEIERIPLCGKAYSMTVFGSGRIDVRDKESSSSHSIDGRGTVIRGFIFGEGFLEISGKTAFTVRNIAFFSERESTRIEDIPVLGKKRRVNINDLIDDFSRAITYPSDADGAPLGDITIENEYLVCPKNFSGEVHFSYKRRAPKISLDVPDFEIPVIPEAQTPLVLLTAAYMIGDAESDTAEMLLKEYRRSVGSFSKSCLGSFSDKYFDTTGWA